MMPEQNNSPPARFFAGPVVRRTKPRQVASIRHSPCISEDLPLVPADYIRNASIESQKYPRESGQSLQVTAVLLLILLADADHQHSESRAGIGLHAPLVSRSPDAQDSVARYESVVCVHDTIPKPASDFLRMLPASRVSPDPGFANTHPSREKSESRFPRKRPRR